MHKIVYSFVIITLSLLTTTSCIKVGPDFRRPCSEIQSNWLDCSSKYISCKEQDYQNWWKVFNDPELDKLVDTALSQNLSLKAAGMRVIESRALLGISIGEQYPQTQEVTGSAFRYQLSENAPNSLMADLKYSDYNLGVGAIWEADFWGKFQRAVESSQAEFFASIENYRDVKVILLGEVASTYVKLRTLQERLQIVESNIKVQARSLEIVDARFRAGMVTELDLQQAKNLLADTEARVPLLEIEMRKAKNALSVLIGVTPLNIGNYLGGYERIPTAPKEIAVGIPANLLNRRPDVRRALYNVASQCARIGVAKADLYPHFSISGFVGLQSSGATEMTSSGHGGRIFSSDSFNYILGPSFAWSLWNYGRLANKVRVEYSRFHELVANYQNSVLLAYQDVENGLITFTKSHERVEHLLKSTEAAQRSVSLSRTQYVEGIADYTRVLNTEEVLLDSEEKLAIARGKIAQGLIDTYRALGGGWDANSCH
ncbi:MAG: TolC family protein [Chlamydiota bacterium]|nr:TolC family protein [Chlamydiota bacterium]